MTRATASLTTILLLAVTAQSIDLASLLSNSNALKQSSSESLKTVMTDFTTTYANMTSMFGAFQPQDSAGVDSVDPDADTVTEIPPVQVIQPPDNAGVLVPGVPAGAVERSTYYVIGDVPYNEYQMEKLKWQMLNIPADAEFLVHLGDIRYAGDRSDCTLEYYQSVADVLKTSPVPVFIILGDNEWNDCPNFVEGWDYWHQVFTNFEDNWNHTFQVTHMVNNTEIWYFTNKNVLHIGMNIVGGYRWDRDEWDGRLVRQAGLLQGLVLQLKLPTVIYGHGNPRTYHNAFFDPLEAFVTNVTNNEVPILYMNGDGHEWFYEPYFKRQPSLSRIMVTGGTADPPLKMIIDPGEEMYRVFSFDRMLNLYEP